MTLNYFSNLGVKYPKWFFKMPINFNTDYSMNDLIKLTGKTRATLCVWMQCAEKEKIVYLVKGKIGAKKVYRFDEKNFKTAASEIRTKCVYSN